MRYVVTGGGSGGHVTPINHVMTSLKALDDKSEFFYVAQRHDNSAKLISEELLTDKCAIFSGKFRRYPRPLWQTLIDIPTHLLNLRDVVYLITGYLQGILYLMKVKPDVVFKAGGYVGVPVCLAATTLRIPFITHDADMIPGLANKLVARWAKYNAVASGEGEYGYDERKKRVVGVPINSKYFEDYSVERKNKAKSKIGVAAGNHCLFVTGGGLGAQSINQAMVSVAKKLVDAGVDVYHIAGIANYDAVKDSLKQHGELKGYNLVKLIYDQDELFEHYIAADLIVARAGAFTTAEIAALGKPAIIVPAQQLADQQVNGRALEKAGAAVVLQDSDLKAEPSKIFDAIDKVIKDEELAEQLSKKVKDWAKKDSSAEIAKLLIGVARG